MGVKTARFATQRLLGLDERWDAAPGSATKLENFRWDPRSGWETVGGYYPLLEMETPPNPRYTGAGIIWSMHWFSRHNGGQQFLLYEDGSTLKEFVGSGTTTSTDVDTGRYTSNSPWQRTQYAVWAGWCWFINGVDEPKRYDGRRTIRAGFDRAPPPPIAYSRNEGFTEATGIEGLGVGSRGDINGGTLTNANNSYRYAVTFVNDLGVESPLSEPSNEVSWITDDTTLTASRAMVAVELPSGGNNVVAIRVYRTTNYAGQTTGAGGVFHFLREIQHNIPDLWIDGIQDASLGFSYTASEFGPWPRGAKYIAFFKGICFLAGMSEYPDRVAYSRVGQPENFPPLNYLPIGDSDGGEITGMYATTNSLVVFKRRGIYLVKGDPISGFYSETLTEDKGNHAPNALREIPGTGLMFVDETGPHLLRGAFEQSSAITGITDYSEKICDTWGDVNRHALMSAHGCIYHKDREYWLAVPPMGDHLPDRVLVYHYDIGEWSVRKTIPISCMAETRDHRGVLMFGSHDTTSHPGLHAWGQGWADYDGDTRTFTYESAWLDFARLYEEVSVVTVIVRLLGIGGNVTLDYALDRHLDWERSTASEAAYTLEAQDPSRDYIEWNEGTWNDGEVAREWRPVVIRFDISGASCREFKFRLVATDRTEIIGWDVEIAANKPRDVHPLNTLISPGTI